MKKIDDLSGKIMGGESARIVSDVKGKIVTSGLECKSPESEMIGKAMKLMKLESMIKN